MKKKKTILPTIMMACLGLVGSAVGCNGDDDKNEPRDNCRGVSSGCGDPLLHYWLNPELQVGEYVELVEPVFSLIATRLASDLRQRLEEGERKIDAWFGRHRMGLVDFSDYPDAFLNINTPEERDHIHRRMQDAER